MKLEPINPSKVLYIKLGNKGAWEHECIYEKNNLKLGYREVPHQSCINKNWEEAAEALKEIRASKGAITSDINQIKKFYEEGEDTLWITFHENCLWWCFSTPKITLLPNNRKTRPVIGKWRCTDINGDKLTYDRLRGSLVSIQGYQGTICSVKDSNYLINKINLKTDPDVKRVEDLYQDLKDSITKLIQRLHPEDFEILIDLIFRQAGWQRVGKIGGSQKTLDLDLISPISQERYCIQIKSKSNLKEFEEYQKRFEDMQGYSRFYYVVHSPSEDLQEFEDDGVFKVMHPKEISEWTIKYGLIDWILNKF